MQGLKRLTVADMKRANVPDRFWNVRLQSIPTDLVYRQKVKNYLERLDDMTKRGAGLFLWSDENSTGKTSVAVLVVKQALRLRKTAFFEESGRLKTALIKNEEFEDRTSLESRVRRVDVFVLDDIGKEYRTETGFAENLIESILRERSQMMKTTIMTGNISPKAIEKIYSRDLAALLREIMIPIEVVGIDWRKEKANELKQLVQGE